jgi:hypothetical protein
VHNQQRMAMAMRRRCLFLCSSAVALAVLLGATPMGPHASGATSARLDAAQAAEAIHDWPPAAKAAAEEMLRRYGPPQEATATLLVWQNNGPWKRTLVHKTPVEHDFPARHMDVLEQVVEYRVPLNFVGPLAQFNGSVLVDRTRGELIAHCDREATNVLALNLAHDIVRGGKTIEQARDAMGAAMQDIGAGNPPADAQTLRLGPPQGDLRDPGTPTVPPAGGQGTVPGPMIVR